MINRRMSRAEFQAELMRRVLARVDLVHATPAELDAVLRQVTGEIELEIKAYWAGRELEQRRLFGERLQ